MKKLALVTAMVIGVSFGSEAQPVFTAEPAIGSLGTGKKILVDDGSCPRNQIKEVTGGSRHPANFKLRARACVPRR
jgi:hypothetical protein